jgi:hypothetical protein
VIRRRLPGAGLAGPVLLALGAVALPAAVRAVGEDPAAEVAEALRNLGPPGMLWGRLALEEESPLGAWTPVGGVEVTLYPATPALLAELERIRQSARDSGPLFESAVARVQAALAVHQARVDGRSPEPPSGPGGDPPAASTETPVGRPPPKTRPFRLRPRPDPPGGSPAASAPESPPHPWRQRTDPAGLFAFDPLPSGDWLVVALRVSPYAGEKLRAAPRPRSPGRGPGFVPRAAGLAREAELWLVRVRVAPGERVGLRLTDRARWLAGPVR